MVSKSQNGSPLHDIISSIEEIMACQACNGATKMYFFNHSKINLAFKIINELTH
jgi:hypothetical protein